MLDENNRNDADFVYSTPIIDSNNVFLKEYYKIEVDEDEAIYIKNENDYEQIIQGLN